MKTVLITGSSTGIGKSTAIYFAKNGWNVVATMRSPEKERDLVKYQNITIMKLDVNDHQNIIDVIEKVIVKFKRIDVLVNNAGYGLIGAFEGMSLEQIRRQFETNVFGLMAMMKEVLPSMRKERSGVVINIASVGGRVTFPLYSVYHSTKWAVEGLSESMQFELEPFNIKIKIVEPGAIKTDFYQRSSDRNFESLPKEYNSFVEHTLKITDETGEKGSHPDVVAKVIFKAATDNSSRLRYIAGTDAKALLLLKRFINDGIYKMLVKFALKLDRVK